MPGFDVTLLRCHVTSTEIYATIYRNDQQETRFLFEVSLRNNVLAAIVSTSIHNALPDHYTPTAHLGTLLDHGMSFDLLIIPIDQCMPTDHLAPMDLRALTDLQTSMDVDSTSTDHRAPMGHHTQWFIAHRWITARRRTIIRIHCMPLALVFRCWTAVHRLIRAYLDLCSSHGQNLIHLPVKRYICSLEHNLCIGALNIRNQ